MIHSYGLSRGSSSGIGLDRLTRADMQYKRDAKSAFALMNTQTGNDCRDALEKGQSPDDRNVLSTGNDAVGHPGYPSYQSRVKKCWWKILFVLCLFWLVLRQNINVRVCHTHQGVPTLRAKRIPSYAFDHAPLVWIAETEVYYPSDIGGQIRNTVPAINRVASPLNSTINLDNLDLLNDLGSQNGTDVFLTSLTDVSLSPAWLVGVEPDFTGLTTNATSAAVIAVEKGQGILDVFYAYFYAFNRGNTVLRHELGDHVGDWEHNMIRFVNGTPTHIWYSQHWNGEAYVFEAVEKQGLRPVTYSAKGSHANYATAGTHDHLIPDIDGHYGLLEDHASRGALWDPIMNAYFYTYDIETDSFQAADDDNKSPVGAMEYKGQWGDEQYPADDPRQRRFLGFWKYVSGPNGPRWKGLDRPGVCPQNGFYCIIRKGLRALGSSQVDDAQWVHTSLLEQS